MGKIVKYCSSCDENFAAKFGFCPNCGAALQAFEMSPVSDVAVNEAPKVDASPALEPPAPAIIAAPEPTIQPEPVDAAPVVESAPVEPAPVETPVVTVPVITPVYTSTKTIDADRMPVSLEEEHSRFARDGGFYVTVIEEKNVGQRNSLLVGTLGFMIIALMSGLIINIFSKDLDIGAINDDIFSAVLVDDVPMTVEEEVQKKNKDDGGGGGGGGRDEKDPASQGDLADQSKTPTRPPNVNTPKSDTPMLETPTTEGTMKFPKIYGKWGDPNGAPGLSNGPGTGGGIGSGRGTGQGNGNGTGAGNGNGSGWGNGNGNGNGDGSGDGDGGPPPPPRPVGVTAPMKILAKPKPSYTDAARQNQVQGTVILRVTFLASGAIGSISPVKGLPNGLTEQAIAAARSIRFEPAKSNGVGQTVTKQVEYTFSIY
ncbi:MAG: TonB family protein [Pyrinomonadaceae bacterium]|nr:TonB family protein [Pyrinomonadaceae bacterium]